MNTSVQEKLNLKIKMENEQRILDLEQRIVDIITQMKACPLGDKTKTEDRLREYSKEYKLLTGEYFNIENLYSEKPK